MRGNGVTSTVGRLATIFVPFGVVLFNAGGVFAVVTGISAAFIVLALTAFAYGPRPTGAASRRSRTTPLSLMTLPLCEKLPNPLDLADL